MKGKTGRSGARSGAPVQRAGSAIWRKGRVLAAACLAVALGASASAWAQQEVQPYGPHMWHDGWHGGWHGWFFGPLMMVLFIVLLAAAVVLLLRWLPGVGHGAPHGPAGKKALDILEERFARGEIDKEEFEERRRILGE